MFHCSPRYWLCTLWKGAYPTMILARLRFCSCERGGGIQDWSQNKEKKKYLATFLNKVNLTDVLIFYHNFSKNGNKCTEKFEDALYGGLEVHCRQPSLELNPPPSWVLNNLLMKDTAGCLLFFILWGENVPFVFLGWKWNSMHLG